MIIGKGVFSPGIGHTMNGTFTLTRTSDGILMETSSDFFFDGSPQPDWALYRGIPTDRNDPNVQAAALATRFGSMPGGIVPVSGRQVGLIPTSIEIDAYDTLFLWCFAPGSPFILGTGPIERT